ncbi:glycosyltransferase family 9 protein, partial [Streptomyces sp. NPDC127079]|uniref:glycosyltransferase family 9 protein n=1 Tax=Streptomyces sp. NPDC127079 TaxID=3347132 RepID=UPI00365F1298
MKALVVRLDSFGDVLLAGPAVRAVAGHCSHVAMLCGPRGEPAARLLPGVDEVLVWEAPWEGFDPPSVADADVAGLLGRLRAAAFDVALVLTSFHQSPLPTALLLRLAGVGRIGADSVDHAGRLLDVRHRRRPGRHEAEAALDTPRPPGVRPPPPPHRAPAGPRARRRPAGRPRLYPGGAARAAGAPPPPPPRPAGRHPPRRPHASAGSGRPARG